MTSNGPGTGYICTGHPVGETVSDDKSIYVLCPENTYKRYDGSRNGCRDCKWYDKRKPGSIVCTLRCDPNSTEQHWDGSKCVGCPNDLPYFNGKVCI